MDTKPKELWYAAAALVAAGLFFRIVDSGASWDEPLSYVLLGLGLVTGLLAGARTGPVAIGRAVRAHPVLVAVLIVFVLITVLAAITAPPEVD